jgi:hypothetical protein
LLAELRGLLDAAEAATLGQGDADPADAAPSSGVAVAPVPMYGVDAVVRRAQSLQRTAEALRDEPASSLRRSA